jgi:hypothetical protein
MLHVECQVCHTSAYVDPEAPGGMQALGVLACPPGSGCCDDDHDHDEAANACPGGHGPCPVPDNCLVWLGMQPHLPDSRVRDTSAGPCPGGHCGLGVPGCTVCRPLKITAMPGSVHAQRTVIGG